jgi:predicted DNA binding CopG/RHH family protein
MSPAKRRAKTEMQVHDFWAKHSLDSQLSDVQEVDQAIQLEPELAHRIQERTKKKLIALRLEQWQLQRAKAIADQRHVPYQHLLRYWISQGLKAEAAARRL